MRTVDYRGVGNRAVFHMGFRPDYTICPTVSTTGIKLDVRRIIPIIHSIHTHYYYHYYIKYNNKDVYIFAAPF